MQLPGDHDPTIAFWSFYLREINVYICTKTCILVFIAPTFYNSPTLEITQMSFNRELVRQMAEHSYLGILFGSKGKFTISIYSILNESPGNCTSVKKVNSKRLQSV